MPIETSKRLTLLRVLSISGLGLVSGIQVALYMYDYYDDGVADCSSAGRAQDGRRRTE